MDEALVEFEALEDRLRKFGDNLGKCSKPNRTKGYLEGRVEGLTKLWDAICESETTIQSLKTEKNKNESYFEDDKFGLAEEKYYQLMGNIKDQLEALKPKQQSHSSFGGQQQSNGPPANEKSQAKLPKITLPEFLGSYHKWMEFKNRFINLIDKNTTLSESEKLEYLKSCVKEEAERKIQRFQITDENYKLAWERLNEKYNNKRILQDTQIEMIIDRRSIKTETSAELRELLDVIEESLAALKILNVDTDGWDPILVVLLKRKLPFKTREEWERDLDPKAVPTFAELVTFLEKRYRAVESLELIGETSTGGESQVKQQSSKIKVNQKCLSCHIERHPLMKCKNFLDMNLANRTAFVNAKKLCKNCLATNHVSSECTSTKTCYRCSRKHHTLLHRDEYGNTASQEPSYGNKSQFFQRSHEPSYANQSQFQQNSQRPRYANQNSFHQSPNNYYPNNERNTIPQNQSYLTKNQRVHQPQIGQTQTSQQVQKGQSNHPIQSQPASQNATNFTTISEAAPINSESGRKEALFPTAIIRVKSASGIIYNLRALLDQCSGMVYIKESVAKMLGIEQLSIPSFEVTGLSDVVTSIINKSIKIEMIIDENESLEVEANIVKNLVGVLPKSIAKWSDKVFKNIKLADSNFGTPNNVDIMLGAKVYAKILLSGVLKEGGYLAQNTKLGWIISGECEVRSEPQRSFTCLFTTNINQPEDILKKFWEIEEAPRRKKKLTIEESSCEEVFMKSYKRLSDGRPQVKLPFKENPWEALGESKNQAVARWLSREKKLEKDKKLKFDYMTAIQEHIDLGHMERVNTSGEEHELKQNNGKSNYSCYYIPHHAVVNEESKTTKTRIVFDASAKTSTGKSLNDILMVGPTIQESLIVRLMKWRCKKYALRGDITKMYRQIKVYDEDINFQRMVFRVNKGDPIEEFGLNTLTFGTASAPYMAIRTLEQIAIDGELNYPVGSKVVKQDFHVDDLLTGGDTINEVQIIWKEVREMLTEAKFPMRKWSSNSNEILNQIPEVEREFQASEIKIEDTLKTLGIGWSPIEDYFFFNAPGFDCNERLTKRRFLSQAAKLFDPLGWLGPAVVKTKIMFQQMWKDETEWDEKISNELSQEWIEFRNEFKFFEQIKIPRWLGLYKDCKVELHGFSDASVKAYGAVIYVKTTNEVGNSKVELLLAKSRVAPVQTVTLPRLELCGGALLSNIMDIARNELEIDQVYCWTDSSITINWINSVADKHKTFVANRIAEIQEFTKPEEWRHVDGKQNPADCLSRGISPKELLSHELWWNGPSWLKLSKEEWPKNPKVNISENQMELKGVQTLLTVTKLNPVMSDMLKKFKSFNLLARVTARIKIWKSDRQKLKLLFCKEIQKEKNLWIKAAQESYFFYDIEALKENKPLNRTSKLLPLNPFIDANGLLRVGGRLKEALIEYDAKHQIVIPKDAEIAKMIIMDAHEVTKHGGTQLTMAYTRNQYWIMDAKRMIKNQIHKCVKCHRYSKKTQNQLMGTLPEPRVNMTRAFLHTGVDYAGPFQVLTIKKPGKRQTTKGWVAVFVCLCTKAIHLEVVSRLRSEEFLAAFTRFYSRRGLPTNMYSDNSTTFIGAKNELNEEYKIIKENLEPNVADAALEREVQWNFIPPHAPHWGGIWEAGVKSMKHHLVRTVGESVYTFEELTTMLAEIEAILNSRPLCPLTNDPNDLTILTPGHFIIGESLLTPPRPSLLEINPNRLGTYKQISQKIEHFAKRWKREYLSTLQHRHKWMRQCENVEINDMVLIKDDDLPPSKWQLGRVTQIFPDSEGLVRKVMVRTEKTELMRPIHKISILPIDKPIDAASNK